MGFFSRKKKNKEPGTEAGTNHPSSTSIQGTKNTSNDNEGNPKRRGVKSISNPVLVASEHWAPGFSTIPIGTPQAAAAAANGNSGGTTLISHVSSSNVSNTTSTTTTTTATATKTPRGTHSISGAAATKALMQESWSVIHVALGHWAEFKPSAVSKGVKLLNSSLTLGEKKKPALRIKALDSTIRTELGHSPEGNYAPIIAKPPKPLAKAEPELVLALVWATLRVLGPSAALRMPPTTSGVPSIDWEALASGSDEARATILATLVARTPCAGWHNIMHWAGRWLRIIKAKAQPPLREALLNTLHPALLPPVVSTPAVVAAQRSVLNWWLDHSALVSTFPVDPRMLAATPTPSRPTPSPKPAPTTVEQPLKQPHTQTTDTGAVAVVKDRTSSRSKTQLVDQHVVDEPQSLEIVGTGVSAKAAAPIPADDEEILEQVSDGQNSSSYQENQPSSLQVKYGHEPRPSLMSAATMGTLTDVSDSSSEGGSRHERRDSVDPQEAATRPSPSPSNGSFKSVDPVADVRQVLVQRSSSANAAASSAALDAMLASELPAVKPSPPASAPGPSPSQSSLRKSQTALARSNSRFASQADLAQESPPIRTRATPDPPSSLAASPGELPPDTALPPPVEPSPEEAPPLPNDFPPQAGLPPPPSVVVVAPETPVAKNLNFMPEGVVTSTPGGDGQLAASPPQGMSAFSPVVGETSKTTQGLSSRERELEEALAQALADNHDLRVHNLELTETVESMESEVARSMHLLSEAELSQNLLTDATEELRRAEQEVDDRLAEILSLQTRVRMLEERNASLSSSLEKAGEEEGRLLMRLTSLEQGRARSGSLESGQTYRSGRSRRESATPVRHLSREAAMSLEELPTPSRVEIMGELANTQRGFEVIREEMRQHKAELEAALAENQQLREAQGQIRSSVTARDAEKSALEASVLAHLQGKAGKSMAGGSGGVGVGTVPASGAPVVSGGGLIRARYP